MFRFPFINTPKVNHRPEGVPEEYSCPSDMIINREIWTLVGEHYAIPSWPDGECFCGEIDCEGQADHLVDELVKKFNLNWKRGPEGYPVGYPELGG